MALAEPAAPAARQVAGPALWLLALVLLLAFRQFGPAVAPWAFDYPRPLTLPAARWIGAFMTWLVNDATFGLFTFSQATRAVSAVIEAPYRLVLGILSTGLRTGRGRPPCRSCRRCRGSP